MEKSVSQKYELIKEKVKVNWTVANFGSLDLGSLNNEGPVIIHKAVSGFPR